MNPFTLMLLRMMTADAVNILRNVNEVVDLSSDADVSQIGLNKKLD